MATTTNPFDVGTGGLVNSAIATTPGTPAAATAAPAAVAQGTAQTYDATKAEGTNWNVDQSKQTVAGQLGSVLKEDSPVLQQARTQGAQQAAARGLVNSSMGVGAAEGAVLDRALQIATPDAAVNANAGKYNADVANNMSLANAGAANQASQFNVGAKNNQTIVNNDAVNKQLSQNTANAQQVVMAGYDAALKTTLANSDNQTRVQLQNIDAQTRTGLATIEANYKTLMQANQGASDLYSETIRQITAIMGNKDLDAPAKDSMIQQQTAFLQSGLTMIGKMNNLGLDQLLTFTPGMSAPIMGKTSPPPSSLLPGGRVPGGDDPPWLRGVRVPGSNDPWITSGGDGP